MRRINWLAFAACLGLACASQGHRVEAHSGVTRSRLWREFQDLPSERALAIAGDPERVWVGGAAGGHASRREAERDALIRCEERRFARRLRAPCRLYASGDEIVWQGW